MIGTAHKDPTIPVKLSFPFQTFKHFCYPTSPPPMERPNRRSGRTGDDHLHRPSRRALALPPVKAPLDEVKLAAIAVDLNVRPRSADMSAAMQERAFRCARELLDANPEKRPSPTHLAMSLKKRFDGWYGPAWHCIVGKSFGSFVTHSTGGFVYFSMDNKFSFLLFKTEVRPVVAKSRPPPPPPPPLPLLKYK